MNQDTLRKIDVFNFEYQDSGEHSLGYIIGKSIVDDRERYVTTVRMNPKEEDFIETFRGLLALNNSIDVRTISIDYRLLNEESIRVLKEAYHNGYIAAIRITPDNALLTRETAEMFNDETFRNLLVSVDRISPDVNEESLPIDLRRQDGLCKIEHIVYQKEETLIDNTNIHVTRKLNSDEIRRLAELIKKDNYQNIIVDFYDPGYYRDLIETLSSCNIPEDITIRLLANPLYDEVTCFENIDQIIPNKIEIAYNTCNDLNLSYRHEPYTEGARYYSDIEASGITDVENYREMIKMIDEIVTHMEEMKYTPLEKISYIHDYFKNNFIYDPDFEKTSHKDNSNLDRVYRKDRMMCEGFSNLYSAILRRAGVLCFTYGTDDHQKNIVRVTDPKYGVDNIALLDVTWDLNKESNRNSFQNFLVPIDNDLYAQTPEVISIPTSLAMASPDYYAYIENSNPVYVTDPLGYGIRMLQLMGLSHKDRTFLTDIEESEFYKSALANSYLTDKIPYDKIVGAVQNVRIKEHEYRSQAEEYRDHEEMSKALQSRGNSYYIAPAIKLLGPPESIVDVDLYNQRVNSYGVNFEKTPPQPSIYQKPRKMLENETLDDYISFLKNYYHKHFYQNEEEREIEEDKGEKNMNPDREIKEYEIDNMPVSQITMYRDIDDSGRIFVSKEVFDRFHITPPRYEVTVSNGEVVYELSTGAAVDILNNANNAYSPYIINFVYIELEEKIIPYIESASLLDSKGDFKNTKDRVIPYDEKASKLNSQGEFKSASDRVIPYSDQASKLNANGDFKSSGDQVLPYIEIVQPTKFSEQIIQNAPIRPSGVQDMYRNPDARIMVEDDNLISGTNIRKPRARGIYETDEEYVKYLEGYYDGVFGENIKEDEKPIFDLLNDNLIPGTNFEKPRVRGIYESDEEYVDYLESYYNSIFGEEEKEETSYRRR